LRVIDYKTGKKSFSRADISEGQGLQMPLYLFSLTESGADFRASLGAPDAELVPAGVLYLSTRAGDRHASTPSDEEIDDCIRGGLLRSGLLLEDEEILRAMDADLSGKYIPVKMNKDGSYSKSSQERLIPIGEMDGLLSEIKDAIRKIAGGIAAGIADAAPAEKDAAIICQNCKMKAVCRNVHS
jgi:ATP-dependent helicase/nuclease subunit B